MIKGMCEHMRYPAIPPEGSRQRWESAVFSQSVQTDIEPFLDKHVLSEDEKKTQE